MRRELQLASIVDIQGSIHANDQKSSAGLVVHGLLFAGVLTVVANIDDVIDDASVWAQAAGVLTLLTALGAFVISIIQLVRAAAPYQPLEVAEDISSGYEHVFFPLPEELKGFAGNQHVALLWKLAAVDGADKIARVYAAEQVKLADIREVQARRAKRGFFWLRVELYAVAGFLTGVVLVAISTPGLAEDAASDRMSLRWTVKHGDVHYLHGGGQLALRQTDSVLRVTLTASGRDDIRLAGLNGSLKLRCIRPTGKTAAPVVLPLSARRRSSDGLDSLQATASVAVGDRCLRVGSTRVQLMGRAQTGDGSSVQGRLGVLTR